MFLNQSWIFGMRWSMPGILPVCVMGRLHAGARLRRLRPRTPELRASGEALLRYYSENAGRMRYHQYLGRGCGIGSGAVESAHKQVVHARFRRARMRWSETGALLRLASPQIFRNPSYPQVGFTVGFAILLSDRVGAITQANCGDHGRSFGRCIQLIQRR
jgi:hypothetical protein